MSANDPIRSFQQVGANVLNRDLKPPLPVKPNTTHANAVRNGKARAGELFGIDLNLPRPRLVEKDESQGVAGLGHCIAALARYLSSHAARVLCNHLAEAITLDGNLLSGFDLVVEFDQMLNEPAGGGQDRERTVTDKDSHV